MFQIDLLFIAEVSIYLEVYLDIGFTTTICLWHLNLMTQYNNSALLRHSFSTVFRT